MSPKRVGHRANAGNGLGQQGVGEQSFFAGHFTGIHIRPAPVSGRIDDEPRFHLPHIIEQEVEIRIIDRLARERDKAVPAPAQFGRKGLSHVTG